MSATEIPKAYDPRASETRWYEFWEQHGLFTASGAADDSRPTYAIAIPPFNVTGSLHMGHACRITYEDALIRYHRMLGRNTLWLPGTDHAGIATQLVVERQLARQGISRHELGREAFVQKVWEWKGQSGGRILQQLRVLGASCDWTREKFTLDPELSRAVEEVFLRLHAEGLIYRDTRLISWCCDCRTALSDLEVENEEGAQGELFDFAYLVEGGGEIVVSTTRPETMLGDTAIAVHPDDPRHQHLIGKRVKHPFLAREVPIIADAQLVDMAFGTGAVKVTPAHDPNDFATGKRHGLEQINILELDGKLNANAGPFAGLERFKARKAVKEKLAELGLARGEKPHELTRPRCHRCNTIIEPMISTQWFCKMAPLAKPAIEAVERGDTQIIPEHWTKTYFHWMNNIQDWCISRQLWWGHPIPAYYCESCGEVHVARARPAACSKCAHSALKQDEDVLDTWFSSALWPFSTLGWPDANAPDLKRFYPTNDMETGSDILFFWVARMLMMGIKFMGQVPFSRVLLSGMVTDERGQKMSKVKGNVIDPLDVVHGASLEQLLSKADTSEQAKSGVTYLKKTYPEGFPAYGADALRFTLLSYSPQTTKMALSMKRVEGYRNFCNKLWNASRFVIMNLGEVRAPERRPEPQQFASRWILSRLAAAIEAAHAGVAEYRLDDASSAAYHFVWGDLCDWYLELCKPLLASSDPACVQETREVLAYVLEVTLRLLHPFIPFLTEELWQRAPKPASAPLSVMVAPYPSAAEHGRANPELEREMVTLQALITAARTLRAEHEIHPRQALPLTLVAESPALRSLLERERTAIAALVNAEPRVLASSDLAPGAEAAMSVVEGVTVIVPLSGLVDPAQALEKLQREHAKATKELAAVDKKLANEGFAARAPADVVETERKRQTELREAIVRLDAALAKLKR
jgi:valyl-tRNA synthetase